MKSEIVTDKLEGLLDKSVLKDIMAEINRGDMELTVGTKTVINPENELD